MHPKETLPYPDEEPGAPVLTLAVRVDEGPDAGLTETADQAVFTVGTAPGNDAILTDETVSRYHLELLRAEDGTRVRDLSSTNGTWLGAVRIGEAIVPPGTALRLGRSQLSVLDGGEVRVEIYPEDALGELRGRTPGMRQLMARMKKVASTHAAVLLVGESGTGKELVAHALHDLSPRAAGPFVTVDCGAMAPNLVASELFGHERGAFTGADRQHTGAFERANGGTLFLDEIGELPRELQPNLLGALERRRFRRVGGRTDIDVDVRLIAATNRDLRAEVNDGRFRLDLYYRLAVVSLCIPPLRERPDDLPLLVEHFLRGEGHQGPVAELFPPQTLDALRTHHWPGNVRELRNLVEATVAMGEAPEIQGMIQGSQPPPGDIAGLDAISLSPVFALAYKTARASVQAEFERRYVTHWLDEAGGNVAEAARGARMDRSHLFHLIKRHRLRDE